MNVALFRPLKPYAIRRANNRTHRKLLIADGQGGPHRRCRHRRGVDGRRPGSRPLARHARARDRARRAAACRGRSRRTGSRRPATCSSARGTCPSWSRSARTGRRCRSCARAPGSATRTPRPSTSSPSPPRARRCTSRPRTSSPRPAFTEALCDAAERGVDVRVLVPGSHIDKGFVRTAGRAVYQELLDCGVRIWEYGPTMLHAKTLRDRRRLDVASGRSTSTTARSSSTTR